VDWRTTGRLTPVKNQQQCGSCWAFSTIGSIEALYNIVNNPATNTSSNFSEQQLVDCDLDNNGCNGGDPGAAMDWEYQNGTAIESAYPYYSANGNSNGAGQCSSLPKSGFQIFGGAEFQNDVVALQNAVASQPIVIVVDASNWSPYSGGIYTDCTTNVDHAVLLVGYTSQYWIIKNSWGPGWGESGFIRVANSPACNSMVTTGNYVPLASPRTANVSPYCSAWGSSYCTNPSYQSYMMDNCWAFCKF